MRLSDQEPQKLTKTVHKTVLAGGMVTCGMVICGMVTCGGALCVYTFQNLDIFYHRW